jgi:hypothetical protein
MPAGRLVRTPADRDHPGLPYIPPDYIGNIAADLQARPGSVVLPELGRRSWPASLASLIWNDFHFHVRM